MTDMFLIEKRGLYYRPNAQGYTGLKRDAGRYTFEEAAERVGPNGPDGPQDGLSMWREQDAPQFSSACAWDVRLVEKTRIRARNEALREAAVLAQGRYQVWGPESGVQCDVTACEEIATAILALIEKPTQEQD